MNLAAHDGLFATGLDPSDYDLPHPRIHPRVILLVRLVFIEAFALLRTRCAAKKTSLATWKEDEVTVALRGIIENVFRQKGTVVPGFDKRRFETVNRQTEVETYDLKSFGKKPDMLFRLHSDEESPRIISTQDGLFVECKPVDAAHPSGGAYCDEGLIRFVEGTYAWAMQEALMVGYVRGQRTIGKHLSKAIAERTSLKTTQAPVPVFVEDAPAETETDALHASVHLRGFPWCGGKGPSGPITVYHSWHQAN